MPTKFLTLWSKYYFELRQLRVSDGERVLYLKQNINFPLRKVSPHQLY